MNKTKKLLCFLLPYLPKINKYPDDKEYATALNEAKTLCQQKEVKTVKKKLTATIVAIAFVGGQIWLSTYNNPVRIAPGPISHHPCSGDFCDPVLLATHEPIHMGGLTH